MDQNNKYNCIIIDDEPIAIKVIREHLERIENLECIAGFSKALDAIQLLNNEPVALLFLDINMPGISGIEFLKTLPNPPKVIFTTAYRNFAVDAFELDAIDYLVKPISFERFLKSINKFFSLTGPKHSVEQNQKRVKDYIVLRSDKKNYKIKFADILYIESLDNYIKVYTNNYSMICYQSLTSIQNELNSDFLRIHRSFIINISKVDIFTSSFVEIGEKKITIGRNYKVQVGKRLNQ